MLRILTLCVFLFSLLSPVVGPASAGDGKAIRDVLARQVAAWNRADLAAFLQGYWESDELTFFSADRPLSGWQATFERYRRRYQGEGNEMGKLTFSDLNVTMLGNDAAFVRGRWHLERTRLDDLGGLFTLVFKRFQNGWKIIHDHTSSAPS